MTESDEREAAIRARAEAETEIRIRTRLANCERLNYAEARWLLDAFDIANQDSEIFRRAVDSSYADYCAMATQLDAAHSEARNNADETRELRRDLHATQALARRLYAVLERAHREAGPLHQQYGFTWVAAARARLAEAEAALGKGKEA